MDAKFLLLLNYFFEYEGGEKLQLILRNECACTCQLLLGKNEANFVTFALSQIDLIWSPKRYVKKRFKRLALGVSLKLN